MLVVPAKLEHLYSVSYIRVLELYCQERTQIEAEIKILMTTEIDALDNTVENLKSIPGVSDKTISAILGECGDLRRFDSAKAFIGYLGLYPTQYQSGNNLSVGRLAKRGIPIAKHATLYGCCLGSVLHKPSAKQKYLEIKISSGKSKKEALIIITKKIAAIMYSITKHNKPYEAHRVFVPNR